MASPPRILRIIILLLAMVSYTNLVYDRRVYDIDRFNGYLSFILIGSYVFSLVCQYRLFNMYTRAFLMILLAFIWLTVNTTWTYSRYIHEAAIFRTDVSFSFPTSLLVVIEAILTLRYESQLKSAIIEDQEASIHLPNPPPPAYRPTPEMSFVGVLPPAILPQNRRDNVEITVSPVDTPPSILSQASTTGYRQGKTRHGTQQQQQIPAGVYFPSSATNPSPSTTQSRYSRNRPTSALPEPDGLPPYSQV